MTPAESRRVAALEQQLAALSRQLGNARGLGVNTAFGATHYRTTQLGFPAELTAAWDATDGYAWKRLRLTAVTTDDPSVQPAGIHAVTPDGDETLGAGDRGWMEPSPDAQGFYFLLDPATDPSSATDCLAKLSGLRANECVYFTSVAGDLVSDRTFAGEWHTASAGWRGLDFFETGDGVTFPVLFRQSQGGMGLKLVGETTTWYGTYLRCVNGESEFAVPYCPPDAIDGSGVDSDGEEGDCADLAGCADHTFRVRVICVACDSISDPPRRAVVVGCNTISAPATMYLTVTSVVNCTVPSGVTIPVYYRTSTARWTPIQSEWDALGMPCAVANGPSIGGLSAASCTNLWGSVEGVETVNSTDPVDMDVEWGSLLSSSCCASGAWGIIATLTDTPP